MSAPVFRPHLCTTVDWSPINAAGAQSAIAALLAGFVFTGIIVVLSVPSQRHHREAAQALKMLLTAFFGLAVTAYLLADMAGEQACMRAETTEALAGGSLGAFAVITVVALTWLVVAYDYHENDVLTYLRILAYVSSSFVVLLLCTSSVTYLSADMPEASNTITDVLMYMTGGIAVLGGGGRIWWCGKRIWSPASANGIQHVSSTPDRAVNISITVALIYLTISSLVTGIAASFPGQDWYPYPVRWAVYVVAASSLVLPLIVLIFMLNAIARVGEDSAAIRIASARSEGKVNEAAGKSDLDLDDSVDPIPPLA
jgi:hypothetical protein